MWEAQIPSFKDIKKSGRGRPPKYQTAEELYDKVQEYFETGCVVKRRDNMHIEYEDKVPTLTGLCLYCGFSDLNGLHYQSRRDEDFFRVVTTAKTITAQFHEAKVASGDGWSGNIFWLKVHEKWVEAKPEEAEAPKTHKYEITVGRKSKCK